MTLFPCFKMHKSLI